MIGSVNRPSYLLKFESVTECVRMDPSCSRDEQYLKWLSVLPEKYCIRHEGTRLRVPLPRSGPIRKKNGEDLLLERILKDKFPREEEPKGFYRFEAVLRCPACILQYAMVPPEFVETSFETFQGHNEELVKNVAKCQEFVMQLRNYGCGFLVMCGLPGNGKTRLACNVIGATDINDVFYATQGRFALLQRRNYSVWREMPAKPAWEIAVSASLLALDEVGTDSMSRDERLVFDEVLKYRYDHRLPTILISNLPPTGSDGKISFKEFIGDALADRIFDATGNKQFLLQFSGKSWRRSLQRDYLNGL